MKIATKLYRKLSSRGCSKRRTSSDNLNRTHSNPPLTSHLQTAASLNKSTTGSLLKQHYERILYPYDIFASGATTGMEIGIESKFDSNNNYKVDPVKSEPVEQPTNGDQKPSNKRNVESDEECDEQCVKKGKTGRTVSRRSSARLNSMANSPISASSSYTKMMNINDAISNSSQSSSPAPAGERSSSVFCKLCNLTREQDRSRKLLECDSCKDNFHTDCLIIPLSSTPKGRWNCPKCVADLVPKLPKLYTHDFGFAESRCKYTLSEFQETADKFKSDYFDRELDEISCDMTEKEFWRLVTCLDDLVSGSVNLTFRTTVSLVSTLFNQLTPPSLHPGNRRVRRRSAHEPSGFRLRIATKRKKSKPRLHQPSMESKQTATARRQSLQVHQQQHQRNGRSVALRRHVLLGVLLAYRGPLVS